MDLAVFDKNKKSRYKDKGCSMKQSAYFVYPVFIHTDGTEVSFSFTLPRSPGSLLANFQLLDCSNDIDTLPELRNRIIGTINMLIPFNEIFCNYFIHFSKKFFFS